MGRPRYHSAHRSAQISRRGASSRDPFDSRAFSLSHRARQQKTNIINRITGKTYALPSTELLRLYEHLEQCRKQGALMYFLERQGTYSGLMLDYDLKLNTNAVPPLEPPALSRLCHRIFVHIKNSSVLPEGSHKIHFFFTLKPEVVQGKYGFHVLIPGLKLAASTKKAL